MPEIGRWLKTFMCEQYANLFEAYGFKTLHSVCQLQSSTLHSMGIPPEHCDKILENVSVLRQSLAVSSTENGVSQDASLAYSIRQNMQAPRYSGSLGSSYPDHGYDHQLGSAGQANAYAYHSSSAYPQQYNGPNGQVSHNMSYPANDGYTGGQPHYSSNQDVYGQSMYNNHLHSNPGSWDDPMLLYNHSPRHVMGSSPPATPSPMMRSPPPPSGGPTMVMPHYSRHIMMEPSASAAHHHPAWAHSQGMSPGMVNSPRATPSPGMGTLGGIVSPAACSPGQGKPFPSPSFAPHPPPAHQQPVSYEYSSGPNQSHSRPNVTGGRPLTGHSVTNTNNVNTSSSSCTPSSDPLQSLKKMVMLEPQNMSNSRPTSVSPGGGQVANKTGPKFSSVEQLAGCGTPSPSPSYASQKSKTPEASSPSVVSGDSLGKSSITGMSPPYSPPPSMHINTSSSDAKLPGTTPKVSSGEVCKPCPLGKSPDDSGQVSKSEKCTDGEVETDERATDCSEKDVRNNVSSGTNPVTLEKGLINSSQENGHMTKEEGEHLVESVRLKQGLKEENVGACPVSVINGPGRVSTGAFREYKERHGSRKFPSHAWDDPNARINRRKKWKEQYERPQMYHNYPLTVEMNGVASSYNNPRTDMNSLINKTDNATERLDAKGYCDKSYYVDRSYGDARYGGYNDDQPVSLTNYNRFSNYGRNDLQSYVGDSQVQLPPDRGVDAQSRLLAVSRVGEKTGESGGVIVSGGGPTMENIGTMPDNRPRASTSSGVESFETDNSGVDNSSMMMVKKKRGRPLGSKNKPKPPGFEKEPRKSKKQKSPKGDAGGSGSAVGGAIVSGDVIESVVAGLGGGGGGGGSVGGGAVGGTSVVVPPTGVVIGVVSSVSENQDSCVKKPKIVASVTPQLGAVTSCVEHPVASVQIKKTVADYKHRGPYIRVSGSGKRGMEVTVVNATNKDEEVEAKNKSNRKRWHEDARVNRKMMTVGFNSTLSANYDVITKDKSWVCVFCHKGSHHRGLGDLYGPYFVDNPSRTDSSCEEDDEPVSSPGGETPIISTDPSTNRAARVKRKRSEIVEEFFKTTMAKKSKQDRNDVTRGSRTSICLQSSPTSPNKSKGLNNARNTTNSNQPMELWVHEDCIVWCHGVYLSGNKIVGLREAMRMASKICSECQEPGASLGCLQKGCSEQYHFLCASEKGCELREDHFCMLCPKHKRQP